MNNFSYFFIGFLVLNLILQNWLARRHLLYVSEHREQVPEAFREQISIEDHQKAADYSIEKTSFSRIEGIYGMILLLVWTLGGGLQFLDQICRQLQLSTISTGVVAMLSVMAIGSILDLPFSIYRQFKLEQKFGFNRTTVKVFIVDLIKNAVLLVLIGAPLVWTILWLMEVSGTYWWFYVWCVWFSFSLLMMWLYPSVIAPIFNKFSPLEEGSLRTGIERLMQQCGFKSNGIFVMDGSKRSAHGNAYFTGIGNNKRIVFFDTLIEQLSAEEIEAVLAHELGHFRLHHIRKRLIGVAAISLGSLALLGWLMQQDWFYAGLGYQLESPPVYIALLLFLLAGSVFSFPLTPITSWLSRRHEFQADEYAAQKRDANTLIQALVKMYQENASTLTPDPIYSSFYDSHPPAPVRVQHLANQTGKVQPA